MVVRRLPFWMLVASTVLIVARAWGADPVELVYLRSGKGPDGTLARRVAAQDGWLYALVSSSSDPDIACGQRPDACVIARWPDDALGKPRELVYKSTVPFSHGPNPYDPPIRFLDGHLVFTVEQEQVYSCDPANCTATLRAHGSFNTDRIASDGEYLYWCATNQPWGPGELRRSARLR